MKGISGVFRTVCTGVGFGRVFALVCICDASSKSPMSIVQTVVNYMRPRGNKELKASVAQSKTCDADGCSLFIERKNLYQSMPLVVCLPKRLTSLSRPQHRRRHGCAS